MRHFVCRRDRLRKDRHATMVNVTKHRKPEGMPWTEFMHVVGHLPDHYFLVRSDLVILNASDSVVRDSSVARDQVVGKLFHPMAHVDHMDSFRERLRQTLRSGSARDVEICCTWNGSARTFLFCGARVSGIRANGGDSYLLVDRDISNFAEQSRTREYQALHDPLTGAFNRWYLDELLRREKHRGKRHAHSISFLMIDVDHLKLINDTHGHLAGDAALKWVSQKLLSTVRESDYVIRFGGDEFLIVMLENAGEVEAVQHRVLKAIATSSNDEPHRFHPMCQCQWAQQPGPPMAPVVSQMPSGMLTTRCTILARQGRRTTMHTQNV